MGKIIAVILIMVLGWCFYTGKININFDDLKEQSIEKMQNEKTIKTINSSRQREQNDINRVIGTNRD